MFCRASGAPGEGGSGPRSGGGGPLILAVLLLREILRLSILNSEIFIRLHFKDTKVFCSRGGNVFKTALANTSIS